MEQASGAVRRTVIAAQASRRAAEFVGPYLSQLQKWNTRSAYLRQRTASDYTSPEEKALARLECGALRAEALRRHAEFSAAAKGEPTHGRIDDLDAAFKRLLEQLGETGKPPVPMS